MCIITTLTSPPLLLSKTMSVLRSTSVRWGEAFLVFYHPPTVQVRIFRKLSSNKNNFNESIAAFFSHVYYLALQLFSVKRRNKGSLLLPTFNHLQTNFHKVDTPDPIFSSFKTRYFPCDFLHSRHHLGYCESPCQTSFLSLFYMKKINFSRVHDLSLMIVQISENITGTFVANGVMLTILS